MKSDQDQQLMQQKCKSARLQLSSFRQDKNLIESAEDKSVTEVNYEKRNQSVIKCDELDEENESV